jgi:hypothetical protein
MQNRRMNPRFALLALLFAFTAAPAAAAPFGPEPLEWTFRYSLAMSRHPNHLASVLAEIERNPAMRSESMMDFVAELLVDVSGDETFPAGSAIEVATLLSRNVSGRYCDAMRAVARISPSSKVRALAKQYVGKRARGHDAQYVPGSIDIPALREKFIADALAFKPSPALAQQMEKLPTGSSVAQLFAIAGPPQHVGSNLWRIRAQVDIRVERLSLNYRGMGRAVFDFDDELGWQLHSFIADPLAWEDAMPYRARAGQLGLIDDAALDMTRLLGAGLYGVRYELEQQYDSESVPLEFLDTTAELLLQNHASPAQPLAIDTYSWMCRLLAGKGGPRYSRVLAAVAAGTDDVKLKRFANLPRLANDDVPRTRYEPGTISLAAQRAKYPTPYPDAYLTVAP